MMACLDEINDVDKLNDDRGTEAWINLLDRGGLWHINDMIYGLFVEIEQVV